MAGLSCQEALTRYKYDARFTPKKEGQKNVLLGALNYSVNIISIKMHLRLGQRLPHKIVLLPKHSAPPGGPKLVGAVGCLYHGF